MNLGKGPKIKKHESMVFDHTLLTPSPPNLNCGLNTIKTSLNKDLVLGDPLPPLDGQRPYFRAF